MGNKKIAFLFPGQGAQHVGMGKDFHDSFREAREVFQWAEDTLSSPLSKIIFEGPNEALVETRHSQVAIFVTSLAILRVLQHQFPSLVPTACAGLSLGEYTAVVAAQRLSAQEALPVVYTRAQAMHKACNATSGGMAALLGLSAEAVEEMVQQLHLPEDLWVANFNAPGQVVISGTLLGINKGIEEAKKRGARRAIPLKVHGAFHSGLMRSAEAAVAEALRPVSLQESPIGLVMNVPGDFVLSSEQIREFLIRQVTASVRWEKGIRALMPTIELFLEIGCGQTLAGMNKQIGVGAPTLSVNTIQDMEEVAKYL